MWTVAVALRPQPRPVRLRSHAGTAFRRAARGPAGALEQVRDTEDFLALAAAAKRTRNILTKSAGL